MLRHRLGFILLPVSILFCASFAQQQNPSPPITSAAKPASPADIKSMDAIIAAVYDVISGPAGKPRDWERFRSLFLPGARLISTGPRPNGEAGMRVFTVEDYIGNAGPFLEKNGFYEREVARHSDAFGHIAQVFSTYESRHQPGEAPFARGINSIQLAYDGQRWWVVTVLWDSERPNNPLPDTYLKSH